MTKRKLLNEDDSSDEFTDFMDIDSNDGVQPDSYDETDDAESLPSTSDMSWSPTDNSTTFFDADLGSKTTAFDEDNTTDDSTLLTEDSFTSDSDSDSDTNTIFEGEAGEKEKGTKALFKKLFGSDDEDEGVSPPHDENSLSSRSDDESDKDEQENEENEEDDETDEDQPLVSNLSEYYVVDDTEEGDAEENDESEFHMVFKKMRLNR